jgi:hypothetical protein
LSQIGISYGPTALAANCLSAQLEQLDLISHFVFDETVNIGLRVSWRIASGSKEERLPYLALTFQVGMELPVINTPPSGELPLKYRRIVNK